MTGTSIPVSNVTGAPTPVTPIAKSLSQSAVRSILKTRASTAVLKAQEGKTTFTLEIRVAAEQSSSSFNLAHTHLAFLQKLSSIIKGDVHFVPTNEAVDPKPAVFSTLDDFPQTEPEHRAFFHRKESTLRSSNQVSIKILHCIITEDNLTNVKKKMLPWLQAHRLWMTGDNLKSEEISVIAWASGAHADMTHKPTFTRRINEALSKLTLTTEQKHHAKQLELSKGNLPEVFATKRLIQFGNGSERVSSEVVAVCCVHKYAEFMKNLLMEIPSEAIGHELIPIGFHLMASASEYREFLMHNNDITLNLRGLTVVNLHRSVWELPMPQDPNAAANFNGTLWDYFTQLSMIDSIQETDNTDKGGRWIFIVEDAHFVQVQALLMDFFQTRFRQMVDSSYLSHFNAYPRLTFAAPGAGQTMHNRVQSLRQKLRAAAQPENNIGVPPLHENAWNRRPRMVFDLTHVQPTVMPTASPAPTTVSTQPSAPPSTAPVLPSAPTDSASVTESTTGQSMPKTVQSQELSTVVSYLDTVLSRQEEQNKRMMEFMTQSQQAQAQQTQAQVQQTQLLTQLITHLTGINTGLSIPMSASSPPAKRHATEMAFDRNPVVNAPVDAQMGEVDHTFHDCEDSVRGGIPSPPATQPHHE